MQGRDCPITLVEIVGYEVNEARNSQVLDYGQFTGGTCDNYYNVQQRIEKVKETGEYKNIKFKFFDITFYKKGTMHIEFTNLELLKKLNIFGSQKKGWLPQSYGKKSYTDMTNEEKEVINSFEGEKSYNDTLQNSKYYLNVKPLVQIDEKN